LIPVSSRVHDWPLSGEFWFLTIWLILAVTGLPWYNESSSELFSF
jgi:hypothetical protein